MVLRHTLVTVLSLLLGPSISQAEEPTESRMDAGTVVRDLSEAIYTTALQSTAVPGEEPRHFDFKTRALFLADQLDQLASAIESGASRNETQRRYDRATQELVAISRLSDSTATPIGDAEARVLLEAFNTIGQSLKSDARSR